MSLYTSWIRDKPATMVPLILIGMWYPALLPRDKLGYPALSPRDRLGTSNCRQNGLIWLDSMLAIL